MYIYIYIYIYILNQSSLKMQSELLDFGDRPILVTVPWNKAAEDSACAQQYAMQRATITSSSETEVATAP